MLMFDSKTLRTNARAESRTEADTANEQTRVIINSYIALHGLMYV